MCENRNVLRSLDDICEIISADQNTNQIAVMPNTLELTKKGTIRKRKASSLAIAC